MDFQVQRFSIYVCLSVCPSVYLKHAVTSWLISAAERKGRTRQTRNECRFCVTQKARPRWAHSQRVSLTLTLVFSASLPDLSPQLQVNNISNLGDLTNNS